MRVASLPPLRGKLFMTSIGPTFIDFYELAIAWAVVSHSSGEAADAPPSGGHNSAYQQSFVLTDATPITLFAEGSGIVVDVDGHVTAGTVDKISFVLDASNKIEITGFTPINAADLYTNTNGSATTRYDYIVSLLDDATTGTGTTTADYFEVGAGNDTVTANSGNDFVVKFKSGDLNYDGGIGSDTLSFQRGIGSVYPPTFAQTLIVDLAAGTGTNPYGATLTLSGVENIIGTSQADQIDGNGDANIIGDGRFDIGADVIHTFGGDDTVKIGFFSHDVTADGGDDTDTLQFSLASNPASNNIHTLDLQAPANNTGYFAGSTFTNFEIFKESTDSNGTRSFVFRGSDGGETITSNVGLVSNSNIQFNGGNDRIEISAFNNGITANGGEGSDTLAYYEGFGANILDLNNQARSTGAFAGGNFTNFEVFRSLNTFFTSDFIDFRGNSQANTVFGGMGGDKISLGGGNDTADGGDSNDIITGGSGKDTLTGGDGDDIFDLNSKTESKGANRDVITDFSVGNDLAGGADDDRIDLKSIDAKAGAGNQAFKFINTAKFHHKAGELHYKIDTVNNKTIVEGDIDGNGKADFQIELTGQLLLHKADFIL
jgi:hypothetical protein